MRPEKKATETTTTATAENEKNAPWSVPASRFPIRELIQSKRVFLSFFLGKYPKIFKILCVLSFARVFIFIARKKRAYFATDFDKCLCRKVF